MSVNRWKLISMPVVMLGLASPLLTNCSGGLPGGGGLGAVGDLANAASGCPELESGDFAKLEIKGDAAVQGKVKGFLKSVNKLSNVAKTLEKDLIASCGELGKALGMAEGDLKAEPDNGKGAEKVCTAVGEKVKAMVADAKKASITLTIEFEPPKCHADVEGMMECFKECGSPIQPGEIKASCEGGEISGKCEGSCKGSCAVEAGADCAGKCTASCSGKCDANFAGTCGGKCDGTCDGAPSKGKACAGHCEGKCDAKAEGTCGGQCEGKCSGSCELKAAAKCSGSCSGGCSVEIKAPKCSGEFKPPKVDANCQASCAAEGAASASCDPPSLKIKATGKIGGTDAQKLVNGLQVALPKIVKIQLGTGKKLVNTVEGLVKSGAALKDVAANAGAKALVCIGMAGKAAADASVSIGLDVKVSASVSASAKGG